MRWIIVNDLGLVVETGRSSDETDIPENAIRIEEVPPGVNLAASKYVNGEFVPATSEDLASRTAELPKSTETLRVEELKAKLLNQTITPGERDELLLLLLSK